MVDNHRHKGHTMSYYYKYQFVSPEHIYANVKEELKSYFDTGAVDDLMFPVWTNKCLRRLGRGSFTIEPVVLHMDNFECKLPPDFKWVREAWMVTSILPITHQVPGAYYRNVTTCLNTDYDHQEPGGICYNDCNPELVNLTYKTTTQKTDFPIQLNYLLTPGNIQCREKCDRSSPNLATSSPDTFDIHGNKFVTNFDQGLVYLTYYSEGLDDSGYSLIPDNYRIQEFIEAFIKQKVFEQLCNQITDETYNQIEAKLQRYTQAANEAYIIAETESKKQTVYEKRNAILREQHSLDNYITQMYGNPRRRGGFFRRGPSRYLNG